MSSGCYGITEDFNSVKIRFMDRPMLFAFIYYPYFCICLDRLALCNIKFLVCAYNVFVLGICYEESDGSCFVQIQIEKEEGIDG